MKRLALFLLLVLFASSGIQASFAPTDERRALIEDINGDKIIVETVSDEIWHELVQLHDNGSERWIGGAVETYGNEWGFRFDPNTIMVAEYTIEMIQTTLSLIRGDLAYWLRSVAVVWAKVVDIAEWVPYAPSSNEVELVFWLQNGEAYINASLTFCHNGYEVSDWGIVNNLTNNLYVNSLVWEWMSLTIPIITVVEHTYVLGNLEHGPYSFSFRAWGVPANSISFSIPRPPDATTVDISPNPLGLVSDKPWVTTYTELPMGYDVNDINVSSMTLNGTVSAELSSVVIGDYDNDAYPDLMVKFSRLAVSDFIRSQGVNHGSTVLSIAGQLNNGTRFEASGIVKVRMPGDINCDGTVDIDDLIFSARSFGIQEGHPDWNPVVDENEDGEINIIDLSIVALNYGKTYP